ncbi:hypothetical protein GUITHDRAFT_162292 [Guillardia theta CCMP2712]|uniref:carbonic anhydrase n=2 Tax=Eukaryota TaxID=2759 RepID=L1JKR2_GUITC|nr:hypothetical protein GUITHDRAFT_162292 [Guillardia theta CCMP2712]EKX48729.1 hypothetical protein GUITHDRAFT_162292 [Guillardia theta CCMP2712]|eukprot:XP_005835709.1 hypothetical protein GUITHDRAFT_162292 [Guillardia theta CCMP2712]
MFLRRALVLAALAASAQGFTIARVPTLRGSRSAAVNVRMADFDGEKLASMIEKKNIDHLMEGNRVFRESMLKQDKDYFSKMAKGQSPKFLWIGCSDARIPANEILGLEPGEIVVHRNVANQVVNTDMSLMAILQFAIEYLEIENIIVAGHFECGGVKASMSMNDHLAPLENWVRQVRDVQRLHKAELDSISDPKARERRLIELNVLEQCNNVYKEAVVQRRRTYTNLRTGFPKPRIFGFTVDPATGELNNLNFDPETSMSPEVRNIYELYDQKAAKEAYADKDEPYKKRPSTWRLRRMYNRQPAGVEPPPEDFRLKSLFSKLEVEMMRRKETESTLKSALEELQEIKKLLIGSDREVNELQEPASTLSEQEVEVVAESKEEVKASIQTEEKENEPEAKKEEEPAKPAAAAKEQKKEGGFWSFIKL